MQPLHLLGVGSTQHGVTPIQHASTVGWSRVESEDEGPVHLKTFGFERVALKWLPESIETVMIGMELVTERVQRIVRSDHDASPKRRGEIAGGIERKIILKRKRRGADAAGEWLAVDRHRSVETITNIRRTVRRCKNEIPLGRLQQRDFD